MPTTASTYIKAGRLCVLGVCDTKDGPVPFAYVCPVEAPDGPIDFGAELPEPVNVALAKSKADIEAQIIQGNIRLMVGQLVERSRAGDQNAMSLLIEIRKRHKRNARAAFAYQCFREYVRKHPSGEVDFGRERLVLPAPVNLADLVVRSAHMPIATITVILADSPYSIEECVRVARTCQGKKSVTRFMSALKRARALRKARAGDIGAWDPEVAAELG